MGLALSAGCFAQSASDVIIKTTSGDKTYKISEVKNLRIEGNALKVNKKTGEAADTYNFDEIKSIRYRQCSPPREQPCDQLTRR